MVVIIIIKIITTIIIIIIMRVGTGEQGDWLTRGLQDQALRTNAVKHRIDGQELSPMCRLCRER